MKRRSLLITIIIIFSFNIISPQSNIKTVNKLAKKCIKGHAKSCEKLNNIAIFAGSNNYLMTKNICDFFTVLDCV